MYTFFSICSTAHRHCGTGGNGFSDELIPLLLEHVPAAVGRNGYYVDAATVVSALEEQLRRRCAHAGRPDRSLEHILEYGEHSPEKPDLEQLEALASPQQGEDMGQQEQYEHEEEDLEQQQQVEQQQQQPEQSARPARRRKCPPSLRDYDLGGAGRRQRLHSPRAEGDDMEEALPAEAAEAAEAATWNNPNMPGGIPYEKVDKFLV